MFRFRFYAHRVTQFASFPLRDSESEARALALADQLAPATWHADLLYTLDPSHSSAARCMDNCLVILLLLEGYR